MTKIQDPKPERLAKRLARAGIASRRYAEEMILDGRIAVDGKVVTTPAYNVVIDNLITVDGQPLAAADTTRLWRYHKPTGLLVTNSDPQGRPTIFEKLPPDLPRVIAVGRLDINSEGLLLLTNDGELARHLELPANAWVRTYRVRVHGRPDAAALARLSNGCTIEGVRYGRILAQVDQTERDKGETSKAGSANHWLTIQLEEGKNREIRRVMTHIGLEVNRLIRVSFGPCKLEELARGAVSEVPARMVRKILRS